ncbi:hypothetical protein M0R19_08805 [Candidatus Pacearchaeota archaeon]|jgi:hypothetical protein|nr:hypothetical protein [Candidatus Pacearchaeota archaeon]
MRVKKINWIKRSWKNDGIIGDTRLFRIIRYGKNNVELTCVMKEKGNTVDYKHKTVKSAKQAAQEYIDKFVTKIIMEE